MDKFSNEDEFDAFDQLEDIDWDLIPGLNGVEPTQERPATEPPSTITTISSSADEHAHQITPPSRPASTKSPNYDLEFGVIDEEFLAQLKRIEDEYAATQDAGPSTFPTLSPLSNTSSGRPSRPLPRRSPQSSKRKRWPENLSSTSKKSRRSSPASNTPGKRKGKNKNTPKVDGLRQMLDRLEDELTCAICSDLFAVAHSANPCGHSCCGECLWSWVSKNKRKPNCPICRTLLNRSAPMIPNFSVNASVARHVEELSSQHIDGWESGGSKLLAWEKRVETWKSQSANRAASSTKFKLNAAPTNPELNTNYVDDGWHPSDDEDEEYHADNLVNTIY